MPKREDYACKCGCGLDTFDFETHYVIEELERWFNAKATINSGCRCSQYNISVGGSKGSWHVKCRGVDFTIEGIDPSAVHEYLIKMYPEKYGIGKYKTFTHLDTRSKRARW